MMFDKLVGRNGHDDLAWFIFDESGEREYRAVSQAAKQAEKHQKSEKTRHDLSIEGGLAVRHNHGPEPLARPAAR